MRQLTHGSLFAGIGGFDLGFERAGMRTVWQVEIDEKCRSRLARRFPGARQYGDIRECGDHNLERVDVIAGGFPCQPFSQAGSRQGKDDNRYLWPEMLRVVGALRPAYVVAENVSGLLSLNDGRVLDEVYDSLEAEAYETLPPLVVPACAFGAGHRRDRVWIIAHSNPHGYEPQDGIPLGMVRDSSSEGFPDWAGGEVGQPFPITEFERPGGREIERDFRGVAHGVSARVDRLKGLGNAIVPQIAEWIGRRIIEVANEN